MIILFEIDDKNYKLGMKVTRFGEDSLSIVIVDTLIDEIIPSGHLFGINYEGVYKYDSVNSKFNFDRDKNDVVKITNVDDME